jgi:nifR3 family TIM-barrel protein
MKLGTLKLDCSLFLAPMAGITDYPFRRIMRKFGCGLAFTEMMSAEGLVRKEGSFLGIGKDEHPISVQIFGSCPEVVPEAAGMAEAMGADGVDINMGCPAEQVVKTGAGADLMRSPEKVKKILTEVRKRLKGTLTVKIRSGWDKEQINAVQISEIAGDCGVDAIFVHPRTKAQGFGGRADWNIIREVKQAVRIPVIGNGDVTTSLLIEKMLKETGCDGVMIGRGALGNPWIFRHGNGNAPEARSAFGISLEERWEVISDHFSLLQANYGNRGAMKEIRRHVAWYVKGLPHSASFRSALSGMKDKEGLFGAIRSYFDHLEAYAHRAGQ